MTVPIPGITDMITASRKRGTPFCDKFAKWEPEPTDKTKFSIPITPGMTLISGVFLLILS